MFGKKSRRRRGLHKHSGDPDRVNRVFAWLGILIVLLAVGYFAYDYHQSQLDAVAVPEPMSGSIESPTLPRPVPLTSPAAPAITPLDRLKIAAASNPEDANRWFELAVFHRKEKSYAEAKSTYRMALRLMPDDFFLNVSYRMFLIESGEEEVLTARLQDFQDKGEAVGVDWQIVRAALADRDGRKGDADTAWQTAVDSLPPKLIEALLEDPMLVGFR